MNATQPKIDVYQIVTNRIIECLEQGHVPWRIPWTKSGIPMNPLNKHPYQGINHWLLASLNYDRNLFLTHKQLESVGARIKKGEHGHILFAFPKSKQDVSDQNSEQQKNVLYPYYYKVYNIAQLRDLPEDLIKSSAQKEIDLVLECESILHLMPNCPEIKSKVQKTFYDLDGDCINMPKKKGFKNLNSYYFMLFHQLIHSTGHPSRLGRKHAAQMAEFVDDLFTGEELIAELATGYLASYTGIAEPEGTNSEPYLNGWIAKLKSDKRFVVYAASYAQRAIDFILNRHKPSSESKEEIESSEVFTEG